MLVILVLVISLGYTRDSIILDCQREVVGFGWGGVEGGEVVGVGGSELKGEEVRGGVEGGEVV